MCIEKPYHTGFRKKGVHMNNDYMAKVYLPKDLAPHVWALAGSDCTSLREGILRACKIAVEQNGNNNHGSHRI